MSNRLERGVGTVLKYIIPVTFVLVSGSEGFAAVVDKQNSADDYGQAQASFVSGDNRMGNAYTAKAGQDSQKGDIDLLLTLITGAAALSTGAAVTVSKKK